MLKFKLDKNLDTIVYQNGNFSDDVFSVITTAEREGWLSELVKAAHEFNPGNRNLADFVVSVYGSRVSDSQTTSYDIQSAKVEGSVTKLIEIALTDNLSELDLSNQNLTELPAEIGKLQRLQNLNLSGNLLQHLPVEIGLLTDLQSINLSGNELTSLPTTFTSLRNLSILDISKNRFDSLPSQVTDIPNLIVLNTNNNGIAVLPTTIGNLTKLQSLNLSSNNLASLPDEFGHLNSLTTLDLGFNRFELIPDPITRLFNLRELKLSGNRLKALPAAFSRLQQLEELNFADNEFLEIESVLTEIPSLASLNFRNNQLTTVPYEIVNLGRLSWINLEGNPFAQLPEFLANANNPERLFGFLRQRRSSAKRPLLEAKVVIAGEAGVGKTSLVNRLVHGTFNKSEETTLGIVVTPWNIDVHEERVRVNIWDFGGQEIMHATHQFFMTKRTIYVVVLDSRRGEVQSRLEYWLKLIRSFAGDSPIIVVCNASDQNKISLDRTTLREKYKVMGFAMDVSCAEPPDGPIGIEAVHQLLVNGAGELNHVTDPIPTKWFVLKSVLESLDKNYVTFEDYLDLANSNDIHDPSDQENLLGFLHDLGSVLWFGDDPRLVGTNVLKPQWVTSAIYKILNSDLLFDQKGRIEIAQLREILDVGEYPITQHAYIADLMQRFELCFAYRFDNREYLLIPDLLPKESPSETGKWENSLAFQIRYDDVLPSSIISRFIVKMQMHVDQDMLWRNGVLLRIDEVTAIVSADLTDRRIQINVKGPGDERRRKLEVIRTTFKVIHRSFADIAASEWVPVPGSTAVIDYERLLLHERTGMEMIIEIGMNEPILVRKLLEGVDPPEKLTRQHLSGPRQFTAPLAPQIRKSLNTVVELVERVPVVKTPEGRDALLLGIRAVTGLNRNTSNARGDIGLLVDQLWDGSDFGENHPLYIFISNAASSVDNDATELGGLLLKERGFLAEVSQLT